MYLLAMYVRIISIVFLFVSFKINEKSSGPFLGLIVMSH
jgi:hypothetical protein